jgi:Tol biopolymer transport system component
MKRIVSSLPTLLAYALPAALIALIALFILPGASPLQNGFIDNTFRNIIIPPTATPATTPCADSQSGEIAFESLFTGNWDIYLVNADGTGLCNLTGAPASDDAAAWSPDGTRIAFTSTREDADGNTENPSVSHIYVTSIEDAVRGVPPARITNNVNSSSPSWSPDGKRLAFYSYVDQQWGLYVANADGGNLTRIMDGLQAFHHPPVWSPMTSLPNSPFCTADLTGLFPDWGNTSVCLIISTPGNRDWAWSPDGSQIAFVTNSGFWAASRDGTERQNLAQGNGQSIDLTWSPDSRQIAFMHNGEREDLYSIYVVASDGTGLRQVTNSDVGASKPRWSPDGQYLVYEAPDHDADQSNGGYFTAIYLVNLDPSTCLSHISHLAPSPHHPAA